jgi:hypothetical protein
MATPSPETAASPDGLVSAMPMKAQQWAHKDIWSLHGKDFLVQVSRHAEPVRDESFCYDSEGPHRWCIYAYIYPKHPLFGDFEGPHMWQDAAVALPLHRGPSFLKWHLDDAGNATSVQVGCDFNHLYDNEYTHFATREDARAVFNDADELVERLARAAVARATGKGE